MCIYLSADVIIIDLFLVTVQHHGLTMLVGSGLVLRW